jgi:hypothetical protein
MVKKVTLVGDNMELQMDEILKTDKAVLLRIPETYSVNDTKKKQAFFFKNRASAIQLYCMMQLMKERSTN